MLRESFWCLVKILHILWCWSGKTWPMVPSYTNSKLLRHFTSAPFCFKSAQTPNSNLLKNLHLCSCSFQVKTSGNIKSTNVRCLFLPTIMRMSKLSAGVHSHPLVHTPAHTLAPTCKLTLRVKPETNSARLIPERGVWNKVCCPSEPLFTLALC